VGEIISFLQRRPICRAVRRGPPDVVGDVDIALCRREMTMARERLSGASSRDGNVAISMSFSACVSVEKSGGRAHPFLDSDSPSSRQTPRQCRVNSTQCPAPNNSPSNYLGFNRDFDMTFARFAMPIYSRSWYWWR